jgi:hypothetical protein
VRGETLRDVYATDLNGRDLRVVVRTEQHLYALTREGYRVADHAISLPEEDNVLPPTMRHSVVMEIRCGGVGEIALRLKPESFIFLHGTVNTATGLPVDEILFVAAEDVDQESLAWFADLERSGGQ